MPLISTLYLDCGDEALHWILKVLFQLLTEETRWREVAQVLPQLLTEGRHIQPTRVTVEGKAQGGWLNFLISQCRIKGEGRHPGMNQRFIQASHSPAAFEYNHYG